MAGGSSGRLFVSALAALLCAALVLGAAGCGGDDGDSTTGTAQEQAAGGAPDGGTKDEQPQGGGDAGGSGGGEGSGGSKKPGASGGSKKSGSSKGSGSGASGRSGSSGNSGSSNGSAGSNGSSGPGGGSGKSGSPGGDSSGDSSSGGSSGSGGSGNFSERSEPFRTAGGDNSIQTFGQEASGSERAAASAVLERYMSARAGDDWASQCRLLSRAATKPMEELLSRSPEFKGKGCAAILESFGSRTDPALRKNTMAGPIDSLRIEGERGFALYHGKGGKDYFVPMAIEAGDWKVASVGGPTEIP